MSKPFNTLFDINMEVATDHDEGKDLTAADIRRFLSKLSSLPDNDLIARVNFVESMEAEPGQNYDIVAGGDDELDKPSGLKGP